MSHRAMKFYAANQLQSVRLAIWLGRLTKIPLFGKLFRRLGNWYAQKLHTAYVLTPDEAKELIDHSSSIAVGDCACRVAYKNCDAPIEVDLVFGVGYDVFREVSPEEYRKISKQEAKSIIDSSRNHGLIQTAVRCRHDFYAICNCCSCCCVPLRLRNDYGIEKVLVRDKNVVSELISAKR